MQSCTRSRLYSEPERLSFLPGSIARGRRGATAANRPLPSRAYAWPVTAPALVAETHPLGMQVMTAGVDPAL